MPHTAQLDLQSLLTHRGFVRSVAARLLRDDADVDEVEQLTWISWWRRSAPAEGSQRGWLQRVAQNHSLNLLRSRSRAGLHEARAAEERADAVAPTVAERIETSRLLVEQVLALSASNRDVILLRYYDGLSVRATADRLGVSPATVKGRVQRGLAELREHLERDAFEDGHAWRDRIAGLLPVSAARVGLFSGSTLQLAGAATLLLGLGALTWQALTPSARPVAPVESAGQLAALHSAAATQVAEGAGGASATDPDGTAAGARVLATQAPPLPLIGGAKEVTLRIGEAFVFGGDGPVPDGDRSQLDLLCQDIRHGASLACFQGSAAAVALPSAIAMPSYPTRAYALLDSAPADLPKRDLWLLEECSLERPGVGFVRGVNGQVYKLCLVELQGHPEALKRTVRIRYEPVSAKEAGGVVRVPVTEGRPADGPLAAILLARERGDRIPGQTFSKHISGDYRLCGEHLDAVTELKERAEYLVLQKPLATLLSLEKGGAVFAAEGIAHAGRVDLKSYSALGVLGSLAGEVLVDSYAYVYVDGDLDGALEIDSYATVYVTGDVRGTLKLRSYADLYVGGRILGELDVKGSCWSTLFLDGYRSSLDLEELEGDFRQITLHVRSSDLAPGEHEDVGTWRKVIVGDPVWNTLGE